VEKAGAKLKSKSGWFAITLDDDKEGNGTNSSGFNALSGGARTFNGEFHDMSTSEGDRGTWWCSTQVNEDFAWCFYLFGNGYKAITSQSNLSYGHSVRCLRD
jgi:uncharacterized protein (TIGR02145 family)